MSNVLIIYNTLCETTDLYVVPKDHPIIEVVKQQVLAVAHNFTDLANAYAWHEWTGTEEAETFFQNSTDEPYVLLEQQNITSVIMFGFYR